uniref:Uncharacterized protein n=1 Tax=Oryza nivara TaxID=4536 RepID=A0A0E0HPY8_ORYNI
MTRPLLRTLHFAAGLDVDLLTSADQERFGRQRSKGRKNQSREESEEDTSHRLIQYHISITQDSRDSGPPLSVNFYI